MNTTAIRILSLFLCLVMVFSLAACGKSSQTEAPAPESENVQNNTSEQSSTEAPAPTGSTEYAWKSDFMTIASDSSGAVQPVLYTDDGFYATGQEKIGRMEIPEGQVEEYEGQYDIYSTVLYFVDKNGKTEKLPNYVPAVPMSNTEGYKDFYSYCNLGRPVMNKDGNLVALEMQGYGWYKGPDEIYGTDAMYEGDYFEYGQDYSIVTVSTDGTELSRAPVELDMQDSWLNTTNVLLDDEGNLVVVKDQSLIAIAPDGSIAWSPRDSYDINSIVRLPDGTIAAMIYGSDGSEMRPLNLETKTFGEPYPIPANAWSLLSGDENYDFYYTSGMYLYGFKLGEEEPQQILNWMNCDINGDTVDINSLNISPDGSLTGMIYDYSRDNVESQQFTLTRVPADSLPKKQVLTVAQLEYYPNYQLSNRMVRFNRSHDTVRLEYKDYTQYNTEDDYSAGLTKFMTEVMAGTLPDIVPLGQLPYKQLASKGLPEDLYPYIDSDKDLKREDIFPNLLSALEVDGGLYQIVSSFSVETLSGAASIVGDTPGWTYDQFNEALAKMPEGCTPLEPYITRDQVLSALLYADLDSFVNWGTGQVNFETDSFKQLLEFVKQFPETYNWEEHDTSESTADLIRQGRQMLTQTYLYSLDSVLWNDVNFGGKATFIGWPTNNGVGSIMRFDEGYAISRNCSDKEAAWEFLRGMLTEEGQSDVYTIPSNRNAFNKQLKEIMTPTYLKDGNGNFVLDENGEKIEESRGGWTDENGEHNIYAMTQEQADELLNVIETCTKVANYDSSIYDIVNEQAQAFFANQKSVDEVTRLIQSKANIYVNEQR